VLRRKLETVYTSESSGDKIGYFAIFGTTLVRLISLPLHLLGLFVPKPCIFFHNFLFLKVNNSRFARVWVVQECILARDLQFQLADGILPTKLLEIAFDTVRSLDMVGPRGSYPFDTRVLGH
jgi:hypothetical protein